MPRLNSQLFSPAKPYPHWDSNWDFREEAAEAEGKSGSKKAKAATTHRHIILVRHGQYDETFGDDARRILTPLGRQQVT